MQAIAAAVKLDGDAFRQPATALSGGMKRRLSLGIALIADPKIVVADEPTTGLDPETRRGVWNILEAERAKGRAILLTTHSMEEVRHRQQLFVCLSFWCVERLATQTRCQARLRTDARESLLKRSNTGTLCPAPQADTLCTRIGVMVRGSLRSIGPQAHLKAKHGDGYRYIH